MRAPRPTPAERHSFMVPRRKSAAVTQSGKTKHGSKSHSGQFGARVRERGRREQKYRCAGDPVHRRQPSRISEARGLVHDRQREENAGLSSTQAANGRTSAAPRIGPPGYSMAAVRRQTTPTPPQALRQHRTRSTALPYLICPEQVIGTIAYVACVLNAPGLSPRRRPPNSRCLR